MSQLLPAFLRTIVPLVYGLLIQIGLGRFLPDETVTTIATVLVTGCIYLILRLLEQLQPKIGLLLGWAKQPQYAGVINGKVHDAHQDVLEALQADVQELSRQVANVTTAIAAKEVARQNARRAATKKAEPKQ